MPTGGCEPVQGLIVTTSTGSTGSLVDTIAYSYFGGF